MRGMRFLGMILGLLGFFSARADGLIVIHDHPHIHVWPPHHPRPVPQPVYAFAPLSVAYHQVDVTIDGQVALTQVDQEFVNPTGARLEGTYIFPLPEGAQVDRFSMFIDGKETEAELLDADKARGIYEEIVRKSRDPALLEYSGRGIFRARIFPIEPHGRKRVKISYRQVLKGDSGLCEYVYPLNTEKFSSAPIERVGIKVRIDAQAALGNVYSPSHKVEVKRNGDRQAVVGWEEKGTRPATDFHLYYALASKEMGTSLVAYRPRKGEDGWFLLLASPGETLAGSETVAKDVVFVMDTSGSMAGAKLEQAKRALTFCVANLSDGDRFEIVRFSTEAEAFFGAVTAATPENRKKAEAFIGGLKPIGGTAIDEALARALALKTADPARPFFVVFLTDGQPTIGETNVDAIVSHVKAANAAATRIFCFGIGTDINTHLLDRVTEATRAASEYVLPEEDIEIKVSRFFTRIKSPVLTQTRLSAGGGITLSKVYPNPLPDLFKGDQLVVLGRYGGSGPVAITLAGLVQGKERTFVVEGTLPEESADKPWIARLWATRRVGYLLDEIRLRGESKELKDEVTALAKEFGIVTPYTAYLILEDEQRRFTHGVPAGTYCLMPEFAADGWAQAEARKSNDAFEKERSGRAAIEGRNDSAQLKDADRWEQASMGKGLSAGGDGEGANYAERQRQAGTKVFYQSGPRWVDPEIEKLPDAKRVQMKFGSEEYFSLARRSQAAARWMALGVEVAFAFEGAVYEVLAN